jgi:predicted nucleic acid-binding protein
VATLLDTNVLLRLSQPHHPHCKIAERALSILNASNEVLNITAQNLVEFRAVITRPINNNGLGFTVEQAQQEMNTLKRLFILLPETPLLEEWEHLVTTYRVLGKNTHDAHLVSAMIMHRVSSILTFNVQDFLRFGNIKVIDPNSLV